MVRYLLGILSRMVTGGKEEERWVVEVPRRKEGKGGKGAKGGKEEAVDRYIW